MEIKLPKKNNKLNEATTAKLETNKDEINQSLKIEASLLLNRAGKLESQLQLLEGDMINNDIKIKNTDQYSIQKNIRMQEIHQSVKSKYLEDKIINVLCKVNVKVTKNDMEACHWLGNRGTTTFI